MARIVPVFLSRNFSPWGQEIGPRGRLFNEVLSPDLGELDERLPQTIGETTTPTS